MYSESKVKERESMIDTNNREYYYIVSILCQNGMDLKELVTKRCTVKGE